MEEQKRFPIADFSQSLNNEILKHDLQGECFLSILNKMPIFNSYKFRKEGLELIRVHIEKELKEIKEEKVLFQISWLANLYNKEIEKLNIQGLTFIDY